MTWILVKFLATNDADKLGLRLLLETHLLYLTSDDHALRCVLSNETRMFRGHRQYNVRHRDAMCSQNS